MQTRSRAPHQSRLYRDRFDIIDNNNIINLAWKNTLAAK